MGLPQHSGPFLKSLSIRTVFEVRDQRIGEAKGHIVRRQSRHEKSNPITSGFGPRDHQDVRRQRRLPFDYATSFVRIVFHDATNNYCQATRQQCQDNPLVRLLLLLLIVEVTTFLRRHILFALARIVPVLVTSAGS